MRGKIVYIQERQFPEEVGAMKLIARLQELIGRREKTPTPKTRVSIWTLLRTPGRFTTRPLFPLLHAGLGPPPEQLWQVSLLGLHQSLLMDSSVCSSFPSRHLGQIAVAMSFAAFPPIQLCRPWRMSAYFKSALGSSTTACSFVATFPPTAISKRQQSSSQRFWDKKFTSYHAPAFIYSQLDPFRHPGEVILALS